MAAAGAVVAGASVVAGAGATVVDASPVALGADDPQAAMTTTARRMTAARPHERPTGHYLTKW